MNKINRRDFLKSISIAAASTLLPGCMEQFRTVKASQKPNVIFIFDDQLRADACSVYGGKNIQTPNIDKLASQGMRFTNALSTCPLCTPFRGMLQTGRYPTHSGLVCNWVEVNPNQTSIADIFASAGYRTGFIGKWHLAAGGLKHKGKYKADNAAAAEFINTGQPSISTANSMAGGITAMNQRKFRPRNTKPMANFDLPWISFSKQRMLITHSL